MLKPLIIGESASDVWIYGDAVRLNPESPTPVFVKKYTVKNAGMAGNVAAHFKSLGIHGDFITQREQITKTRFVDETSNYILLRVDEDGEIKKKSPLDIDFAKYDIVVVSDYNKGFLSESDIESIILSANKCGKEVFLDTKKILGEWSKNAWVKINEKEYLFNLKNDGIVNNDKTIVTMGQKGARYKDVIFNPKSDIEVRSVAGAGDTFLVFFSLFYYKTKSITQAITKANFFAGVACSKRGVVCDFELTKEERGLLLGCESS